jgi:hypothetical protein
MKTRLFTVFVLTVSMAALVLSPSALLRIDSVEGQNRGAEGLAPVPGGAGLKAAQAQLAAPVALASAPDHAHVSAALRSAPPMFIENVGQFDQRARFQVYGGNATLYLAEGALWFTVLKCSQVAVSQGQTPATLERFNAPREDQPCQGVNLKLSFVGANPHPHLEPFNRLDTHVSYFVGNDPANWRADVPVWGGVRYVDLYPGMDLEVMGDGGRWAWRLAIRNSQFAISSVRLRVDGADALTLGGDVLRLTTPLGDHTLPLLQVVGAAKTNLANPTVTGDQVAWPFASAIPNSQLVLSPVEVSAIANLQTDASDLLYSTFLGGSGNDRGAAIAVDGADNAYVAGGTQSSNFPTTAGAFDTGYNGDNDAFVVKINADGTGLAYATFLGGSGWDSGRAIAVDGAGHAYVTGETQSSDFPTTAGAFDTNLDGHDDAFVVKVNADGTGLAYATFLGGAKDYDYGAAIAVDGAGSAYVTGYTESSDFPTTPGAFDPSCGTDGNCNFDGQNLYRDAFVVKMSADGTGLVHATFLGGSDLDLGSDIAVDAAGSAYVVGRTPSSDFPTTPGAFDTSHNGLVDTFVVKMNADGTGLTYATFLGGNYWDDGSDIAVDGAGSAYVTGMTQSPDFPTTPRAFDTSHNGKRDAFVVKVNADGTGLTYATFLGGSNHDFGSPIAVDGAGNAYVTGHTDSSDFPTTAGAFDTSHNGYFDAFLVKVNAAGTGLAYATFLGGHDGDAGYAIAVDGAGNAYVTGHTDSSDFPTTAGAFDTSYNGGYDAFVAKISIVEVTPTPMEITNPGFEGGFFGPVGQSVANGWAFYIAGGEPTFDGEYTTVHSGGWAQKVSGHAPFAAGLAQALTVKPGTSYRVTAYYHLYPPGDGQAFLGVQDGTTPAQWVGGGEGGVWRLLSQTVTVASDQLIIYLHGHNGTGLNTNVYFDDVTVTELGQP